MNQPLARPAPASLSGEAMPYQGLRPYELEDAGRFYGRERESQIVEANLMAARLTVLYGTSGVGKSSLLRAGVGALLHQRAERNIERRGSPGFALVLYDDWRDDPLGGLLDRVRESVREALGPDAPQALPSGSSFADTLQGWAQLAGGELVIILDQLEEYFLYHPQEEGEGTFAVEFPRAINRANLRVHFLISIREDALAKLDRFQGRIPGLLNNVLRVEHLDREAARAAIVRPVAWYNERLPAGALPVAIEDPLVEAVLHQVQAERVTLGSGGQGVVQRGPDAKRVRERIEAPYLQLVMTYLWRAEMDAGSRELRRETLARLGDAQQIVRRHLQQTLDALPPQDQDAAADAFGYLVTPSGAKIAHTLPDLAHMSGVAQADLAPVLEALARREASVLRPVPPPPGQENVPRYEIFHDVLAEAVLQWRLEYTARRERIEAEQRAAQEAADRAREAAQARELEQARALSEEQQRRANAEQQRAEAEAKATRRLALLLVSALVILALLAISVGFWAVQDRAIARNAEATAEKNRILAQNAEATAVRDRAIAQDAEATAEARRIDAEHAQATAEARRIDAEHAQATAEARRIDAEHARATAVSAEATAEADRILALKAKAAAQADRVLALNAEATAVAAQGEAVSRALAAAAIRNLDLDPERSALLAIEAVSGPYAPGAAMIGDAENALHEAIQRLRTELVLTGHDDAVRSVAYSPDGTRLATASDDGTVRLWDAQSGAALPTLLKLQAPVYDVAFSPDGTRLATAGEDSVAKVWDADSGRELLTLAGHQGPVYSVVFASNGEHLFTTSDDKTAIWWDARSGQALSVFFHDTEVWSAAVHPGGRVLITAGQDGSVSAWDLASGNLRYKFTAHYLSTVWDVAFSRDGTRLATVSTGGTVKVWDTSVVEVTPTLRSELSGRGVGMVSVAFSPDGRRLATGSRDRTARIWDVASGQEALTLAGHGATVRDLAFNAQGTRLATASEDGTARVWDLGLTRELLAWPADEGTLYDVTYSPDGGLLLSGGEEGTARVWDAGSGDERAALPGHTSEVMAVSFAPGGDRLATVGTDGTARVWIQEGGSWTQAVAFAHGKYLYDVVFLPTSGPRLATAGGDGTARIWDARTGNELQKLDDRDLPYDQSHELQVTGIAVSPDGVKLATCSRDETAKIWDAQTGEPLHTLRGHDYPVWAVAFSPGGALLATGGEDGTVKLWDVDTGAEARELVGHTYLVRQIAFGPYGAHVATASFDGRVKVWEVKTGRELLSLSGHSVPVHGVAFSPDGRRLATAGEDGTIQTYALDLRELMTLACSRVTRNLTADEWALYMGQGVPYRKTCPGLPVPE